MAQVNISICIPAYKRIGFVSRLLESVAEQTYKDYEVIITDDSSDDEIYQLCKKYEQQMHVRYFKNNLPLGSPENWNEGIRKAQGKWIKIMHDDDWFADPDCLQQFAEAARQNTSDFIFSGFCNHFLGTEKKEKIIISGFDKRLLQKNPCYLLRQNYIGHPSTTLIRNNIEEWFDKKLKWVVDIEFYIRILGKKPKFKTIDKPLINIGISNEQITHAVFRNPEIEIPENIYLLNKITAKNLKAIFAYDYFWRFLRNLSINNIEQMKMRTDMPIPYVIRLMIGQQSVVPASLLKIGIISKALMFLSYIYSRCTNALNK
jgi:glycosyltransferase involved in cell wall biosynthesis